MLMHDKNRTSSLWTQCSVYRFAVAVVQGGVLSGGEERVVFEERQHRGTAGDVLPRGADLRRARVHETRRPSSVPSGSCRRRELTRTNHDHSQPPQDSEVLPPIVRDLKKSRASIPRGPSLE